MEAFTFQCSICGDSSTKLCVYCTKDACNNHLCDRCHRCSDCCLCELPSNAPEPSLQAERTEQPARELETQREDLDTGDLSSRDGSFGYLPAS
jgi:hypothetical protein